MSFLSGLFGDTNKKTARRSYVVDQDCSDKMEEVEDDGFVLLSAPDKLPQVCKQTSQIPHSKIEFDQAQQTSSTHYCQSGPSSYQRNLYNSFPSGKPAMTTCSRPKPEATTFITVADVPLKFHKYIEATLQSNTSAMDERLGGLNIQQYSYDFALEKEVLQEAGSVFDRR